MNTIRTIRVRDEWVDEVLDTYGTVTGVAKELGVEKSTASRWLSGKGEASARFIGAVLMTFPISFDEAFVATEEVAERRRTRCIKQIAA
ncbi:helix-turn-helix domain-containing protein [Corynebacterium sp. TAE3-ERU12]|uniref:helix-turn-helix domain-containing protein n=1 Tax=Corynebacterium sp. TAE3-ERU12 TaxID=2849491 RepID=UPI001C443967|nr:helix-turn-helix domain-containing protein [Corynebacterium sp. TAE3-ERU12]MBV7294904.1 helix-turn-helix domain-containing protein [Corynebacterium sp. TAE3-ERU12]